MLTFDSKIASKAVQRGELVSDEIVTDLIVKEIKSSESEILGSGSRGYILDGFPRTLGNTHS